MKMQTAACLVSWAVTAGVVVLSSHSFGGDLERFCRYRNSSWTQTSGCPALGAPAELTEAWLDPTDVTLKVKRSTASDEFFPGYPICGPTPGGSPGWNSISSAVETWNNIPLRRLTGECGVSSSPPGVVSTLNFSLPDNADTLIDDTELAATIGAGGENVISLVEDSTFWSLNGGDFGLAVGVVATNANGIITDADIALHAIGYQASPPEYGFVEYRADGGVFLAHEVGVMTPANRPVGGYCDVQGFLTHELGHAAGLGHSVLDGEGRTPNEAALHTTHFPTMFFRAQIEPIHRVVWFMDANCNLISTPAALVFASGNATRNGGILGLPARSLEVDDVTAIGRGYPTPGFFAETGRIKGTVAVDCSEDLAGTSVVAVSANCPAKTRLGTLAYSQLSEAGSFDLSGIPPGDYYLYSERIDISGPSAPPCGSLMTPNMNQETTYFPSCTVAAPNYLELQALTPAQIMALPVCTNGFSGCEFRSERFLPDFWAPNDGCAERSQTAQLITIQAGQTINNVHIEHRYLQSDLNQPRVEIQWLRNSYANGTGTLTPTPSLRGAQAPVYDPVPDPVNGEELSRIRVTVTAPQHAGQVVLLYASPTLQAALINGQLLQVAPFAGAGIPGTQFAQLDVAGEYTMEFDVQEGHVGSNLFFQASINNNEVLTNMVNLMVTAKRL